MYREFSPVYSNHCLAHGADTSVSDVSVFWSFSQGSNLCSGRHCLRRQLAGRGAPSLFAQQKLFMHQAVCVNWTLFPLRSTQLKPHTVCKQAQTQTNSNSLIDNIIYKTNRQCPCPTGSNISFYLLSDLVLILQKSWKSYITWFWVPQHPPCLHCHLKPGVISVPSAWHRTVSALGGTGVLLFSLLMMMS